MADVFLFLLICLWPRARLGLGHVGVIGVACTKRDRLKPEPLDYLRKMATLDGCLAGWELHNLTKDGLFNLRGTSHRSLIRMSDCCIFLGHPPKLTRCTCRMRAENSGESAVRHTPSVHELGRLIFFCFNKEFSSYN